MSDRALATRRRSANPTIDADRLLAALPNPILALDGSNNIVDAAGKHIDTANGDHVVDAANYPLWQP